MKNRFQLILRWLLPATFFIMAVMTADVMANDLLPISRADYDLIMRWVNFIILAALIIKFARRPIIIFFKNQKNEIRASIQKLEAKKQAAEMKISECREQLASSQKRLALIKERIIAQGQKRKDQIIAQANNESHIMLENARSKIHSQIHEARQQIKAELIDTAVERALRKLPTIITSTDHDVLLHHWLESSGHNR